MPHERVRVDGVTYETVGGDGPEDQRCDPEYEAELVERNRAKDLDRKSNQLAELRAHREHLTIGQRLDEAIRRIPPDGLPASRPNPTPGIRGATDAQAGPPRPTGRERELEQHLTLIRHHLQAIERIGDEERGLLTVEPVQDQRHGHAGGMQAGRLMTTRERDRIVWDEFQGIPAQQVAEEAPYLGTSARTIERARKSEANRRRVIVRQADGTVLRDMTRDEIEKLEELERAGMLVA